MKFSRMLLRWPASAFFRKPYTCNIKITQRCNLRCHFCGLWKLSDREEMSISDYSRLADLLKKIGIARVVITGGEPLLRDDSEEIVGLFARKGFSTTLLTNGTLLDRDRMARLSRNGLSDIGISLDTLDSDAFDAICGSRNQLDHVLDAIRSARSIHRKGFVMVMITISHRNIELAPDIVRFVTQELDCWAIINPVNITQAPEAVLTADRGEVEFPLQAETVDRVYDRFAAMKRAGAKIMVSSRFLADSRTYLKSGNSAWNCHAGISYFTIFSDGSLAPCSDLPAVANVRTMTPEDFGSNAFRDACDTHRMACPGCIFSCWREASYLLHDPRIWPERFRDFLRTLIRKG